MSKDPTKYGINPEYQHLKNEGVNPFEADGIVIAVVMLIFILFLVVIVCAIIFSLFPWGIHYACVWSPFPTPQSICGGL